VVQDFGNFQDSATLVRKKTERESYGRFFYRFPNGESGADVYDRLTIYEDHLVRDIDAGRFTEDTAVVIVTHGLSLRVFLMRWNHWSVADYEEVHNPPNCAPLELERVAVAAAGAPAGAADEEPGAPVAADAPSSFQ
jgi:broad specificity phosphatase PhoE